jgi:tRNA (guanine26-N2/guanine27-N2)-dimethyltransferase
MKFTGPLILFSKFRRFQMEISREIQFQSISEGSVTMQCDVDNVFYNKVQVFNRDLSIQVIKMFSEKYIAEKLQRSKPGNSNVNVPGIRILDALAASGLRSIRYLKEIPNVSQITINDLSLEATRQAQRNCESNSVDLNKVRIENSDAIMLMYNHRNHSDQFDVIDLDPYGTAVPFLDAAVQAVRDGGLMCVTCTDMTVLSGKYPEKCFSQYQTVPVRGKYLHELSLRILLHTIDITANKYGRYIEPWISVSVDFYVRVFVRVFDSPRQVKNSIMRRCMVYQCIDCPQYYIHDLGKCDEKKSKYVGNLSETPSRCEECGGRLRLGGPFWSAPLHHPAIVDELLDRMKAAENQQQVEEEYAAAIVRETAVTVSTTVSTTDNTVNTTVNSTAPTATNTVTNTLAANHRYPIATIKRIIGILTAISEELKEVVLYLSLPELASAVQLPTPTLQEFFSVCKTAGYRVSQFHHDPTAVKTDAPNDFVRLSNMVHSLCYTKYDIILYTILYCIYIYI